MSKKIMIVDDASFMRMVLKDMLIKNGHDVIAEATNGKEAFDRYREYKPDLVTMDITMPDVDGIEGVKLIKGFDPNAKIIMCSAMGQESMVKDAVIAGARDFIVKPFKEDRIVAAITKLV